MHTLSNQIEQAVTLLRHGELIIFPTETVYGLGADAKDEQAVKRIYDVKKRPYNHPLIVHIADATELEQWAININQTAWLLAEKFWPGPLTLILSRAPTIPSRVTGGRDTIAIRVPSHPVAQELLHAFQGGIAAPSANAFGKLSPTHSNHISAELREMVKLIIDGGRCQCGLESTIIDMTQEVPNILRLGAITIDAIATVINQPLDVLHKSNIAAPGTLAAHYAPFTPLQIIESESLKQVVEKLLAENKNIVVVSRQSPIFTHSALSWIKMSNDPSIYAYELYATLHDADKRKCDTIIVEAVPNTVEWLAIRDRLQKAAAAHAQ